MGGLAKTAIVTSLLLLVASYLQPYRVVMVRGHSMSPSIDDGDLVISSPLGRKPKVGDIVVVDFDGGTLIKRVAMVAGDRLEEAYIPLARRWVPVDRPALRRMVKSRIFRSRTSVIPEDRIFLLGDNPELSRDSRAFGLVPVDAIRGVVVPG